MGWSIILSCRRRKQKERRPIVFKHTHLAKKLHEFFVIFFFLGGGEGQHRGEILASLWKTDWISWWRSEKWRNLIQHSRNFLAGIPEVTLCCTNKGTIVSAQGVRARVRAVVEQTHFPVLGQWKPHKKSARPEEIASSGWRSKMKPKYFLCLCLKVIQPWRMLNMLKCCWL